jgi:hypothetical protein
LASFGLQSGTPQSGHSSLCLTTLFKKFQKAHLFAANCTRLSL